MTHIRLTTETKRMLTVEKTKMAAESYDETIRHLITNVRFRNTKYFRQMTKKEKKMMQQSAMKFFG